MRISRTPLLFLLTCFPAWPAQPIQKQIAPGVELTQIVIPASDAGGPELIHSLDFQPGARGVHIECGLGGDTVEEPGGGMEAISHQVQRTGALAGINADFFPYTGDPLGLAIHQGEIVSEAFEGRGAIGFGRRGKVIIGRPAFHALLTAEDGSTLTLNGINRKPGDGETVLLTPVYGDKTPVKPATLCTLETKAHGLKPGEALKAKVIAVTDEKDAVPMPAKGMVLTATGAGSDWLKAHAISGKTIVIKGDIVEDGNDWTSVREAVAGGPVLLHNGDEDIEIPREKMSQSFSTTRHPRSAIGVTKDGTVLIVAVDGRQALSRGMSLPELARTLKDLGAINAVNLDGGGSTCLSVRGIVINCPSDGQVRQVADALLVFDDSVKRTAEPGPALAAPYPQLTSDGTPVAFSAPDSGADIIYGTQNGGAFVSQDGKLYGYKPGLATAEALDHDGKWLAIKTYNVLPGPAGKMVLTWVGGTLQVTIRDVNNNPVQGQEIVVTKADGTKTEIATGKDGRATVQKGWLKDEHEAVTLVSGVLSRSWPDTGS